MDIIVQNTKYRIRFTYVDENGDTGPKARTGISITVLGQVLNKRITTYADILIYDENDPRKWRGIAGSWSANDSRDRFNKRLGRRIALGFALRQIKDRELRKTIWESYFAHHSDGFEIDQIPLTA
jgi:hypothetical protein